MPCYEEIGAFLVDLLRRHASLGTTMTSPSTRRRSLENTMSLLKEAADGKERDEEFEQLADQVAGGGKKRDSLSGRSS